MSDRFDARMSAFVVELLDDPPEAPPFPHPDMVVVKADRPDRREPMTDTQIRDRQTASQKRWKGPAIAVGALVAVLVLAGAALLASTLFDEPEPTVSEPTGADALVGTTGVVVGGLAGTLPYSIEYAVDGTYLVSDNGETVDTGVYTTDGDVIAFDSAQTNELMWVWEPENLVGTGTICEGVVGEYQVVFGAANSYTFDVVHDACSNRISVVNGLQLELVGN